MRIRSIRARFIVAAVLLMPVGACRESRTATEPTGTQAIRIEPVAATFNRGTSVQLDLVNDSTFAVGSNACAERLEVLVGGDAWGTVPNYEVACFTLYVTAQPGGRARVMASLPASLPRGTYRTFHVLGWGNLRIGYTRYSTPFQVR